MLASCAVLILAACGDEADDGPEAQSDAGNTAPPAGNDAGSGPAADAGNPFVIVDAGGAPPSTFDAGADPNRNTVAAGGVCMRFAELQCAGEQACCASPGRTFEACVPAQAALCRSQGHIDEASQVAAAGFDPARLKTAFDTFEALAKMCDTRVTALVADVNGIRGAFVGTFNAGESCTPSIFDLNSEGAAAGYALSCRDPANTACMPDAGPWMCVARGGAGTRCFTDENCSGDTFCNNPMPGLGSLGGDTRCEARKPVGAACIGVSQCATLACVGGQCVAASSDAAYCLGR